MKIILIISILFYSSNWVEPLNIPIISNIQDIIGLAHDVGNIVSGNIPFKNLFVPAVNPILPVLEKLDGIAEQIENLDSKLDDLLASLIARLPLEDQINTDIRDLQEYIAGIDEKFDECQEYFENITIYDNDTLVEFMIFATSTQNGYLLNILNKISNIVVPKQTALARIGFLENMLQKRKIMSAQELCNPQISFQNRLLQIYNLLSITEMRSFLMTTFGFRLKMEIKKNCPNLEGWGHYRCYNYENDYCMKHCCRGHYHSCGWIGGDVDMCEYPESSTKRYEYVRSYINGYYGKWTECKNGTEEKVRKTTKNYYNCDTCICKCEEVLGSSNAIKTFSLRPQISNIAENKVVSDVKFTKKDRMIHIQIEEAPLLPLGQVDRNGSALVPLEDFIYLSELEGGFVQVQDGKNINMTRDVDFTFIRPDHKRLNLDDISAGPNYILTGVKLGHESKEYHETSSGMKRSISPLQLEIHVTPFNYASGELNPTEENPSVWLTPLTQPHLPLAYANARTELGNGAEKVYKFESAVNLPHLKPNQYIEFKQSTIWSDAGQSTIPFMDSRPVAPNNSLAFDGLGLSYRGHEEYGGFVILKPLTLDATNYMDASMTDKQRSYYMKTSRQGAAETPPKKNRKSRKRN